MTGQFFLMRGEEAVIRRIKQCVIKKLTRPKKSLQFNN
jgi:hypothetical protein